MKIKRIVMFVLCGVLLAGCSTSVPVEMRALMVGTEDIPAEWIIFKESTAEDWGGQLYNIAFAYGNDPESPALEHQLVVYTNAAAAIKGFEEYTGYIFAEGWEETTDVTFTPMTPEDLFEVRCSVQEIEHVLTESCFVLQKHDHYVSALGIQLGGPLTFDVLNSILQSVDQKLNSN